jgi:hypothetical protein
MRKILSPSFRRSLPQYAKRMNAGHVISGKCDSPFHKETSMSDLYVNADELLNLSATLSQRVTTMEMYIEQFSRALQLLASRWEGEAERAAFESAMQTLQQLVKTAEALANAKALVDSAVETYNATEEAVGALWSL